jgi:hypothetical protein
MSHDAIFSSPFAPTLTNLPSEILTEHILSHITTFNGVKAARSVCKLWSRIVLLPRVRVRYSLIPDDESVRNVFRVSTYVVAKSLKSQRSIAMLFDGLCDETSRVAHLTLNNCVLKEDTIRKLGHALNCSTTLQSLNFDYTVLGLTKVTILASVLQHNNYLKTISLCSVRHTALALLLPCLARFKSLSRLHLSSCDISFATGVALADIIRNSTKIVEVTLYTGKMDDAAASKIGDALAQNASLICLRISPQMSPEGFTSLLTGMARNSSLTAFAYSSQINLDHPDVLAAVCHLLERSIVLQEITISYGSAPLSVFLRYCAAVAASKSLRSHSVDESDYLFPEQAAGVDLILKSTQHLEKLVVYIHTDAVASFSEGIASNRTVTRLQLNSAHLSPLDFTSLASGLSQNTTLTTLIISSYYGDPEKGQVGSDALYDALAVHTSIKHVKFTRILPPAIDKSQSFIKMLQESKSLRSISFSGSSGEPYAILVTNLILGLSNTSSVTRVDLSELSMPQDDFERLESFAQTWPGQLILPSVAETVTQSV